MKSNAALIYLIIISIKIVFNLNRNNSHASKCQKQCAAIVDTIIKDAIEEEERQNTKKIEEKGMEKGNEIEKEEVKVKKGTEVEETKKKKKYKKLYIVYSTEIKKISSVVNEYLQCKKKVIRKKNVLRKKNRIWFYETPYDIQTFPYAPEVYKNENVIGYTGKLDEKPTVYYFKKDPDYLLDYTGLCGIGDAGHITQDHKQCKNIGRDYILNGVYIIYNNPLNENKSREVVWKIFDDLKSIFENPTRDHYSRNPLILLNYRDDKERIEKITKKFSLRLQMIKENILREKKNDEEKKSVSSSE